MYQLRNREVGEVFFENELLGVVQQELVNQIQDDKENSEYEANWYEIYNTETEEVIEVA